MKPLPTKPGAYTITHRPTGRFYVGSTGNLQARILSHKSNLRRAVHNNQKLQEVVTSIDDLVIVVDITDTLESARDKEQRLLDTHLGDPNCCNVGTGARSLWVEGTVPEELRAQTGARSKGNSYAKGHVVSEEARDAVRRANTGLKRSDEVKARMSAANTNVRAVVVNGVEYPSIRKMAIALGLHPDTARSRILSTNPEFCNWRYS